jgi:hypothetical protein
MGTSLLMLSIARGGIVQMAMAYPFLLAECLAVLKSWAHRRWTPRRTEG